MMVSRNQLMSAAHGRVHYAIKTGKLQPPSAFKCVDCGVPAAEYDHRNYLEPLIVEPVCTTCNCRRPLAHPPLDCGEIDAHWMKPSNVRWRRGYIGYYKNPIVHKWDVTGEVYKAVCGLKAKYWSPQFHAASRYPHCKKCWPI